MINTHILKSEFEYLEPKTIEEALEALFAYGEKAKILAGGTDLLVEMKMESLSPEYVINISGIPALRYLRYEKNLRIGPLIPFREIEKSQEIKKQYTALFEAARSVSSVQIKYMGTIGGNLCHASPAADAAPPLIVFGAKVRLLEEKRGRVLPLEDFFTGVGETVLRPKELLTEIEVPELVGPTGSAFLKMGRVASDLAKVSAAVHLQREGDTCKDCKIAMGAVAKTPRRTKEAETILRGKKFTKELAGRVAQRASEEIQPITDIRSTAWYRTEVSKVLVRDALLLAWERSTGETK